jgi:hypothetical protein
MHVGLFRALAWLTLLVVSLTPLAVSAQSYECSENDILVTTTPIPPQKSWSISRLKTHKNKIQEQADVVILGDSMAERWPQSELNSLFPNQKVVNIGLGGDVTQITKWRLKSIDYSRLNPTRALLFLGTNNLGSASACAIRLGIEQVLLDMYSIWPNLQTVYVLKIFPKGDALSQFSESIRELNDELDKIDLSGKDIRLIAPPEDVSCGVERLSKPLYAFVSFFRTTPCEFYEPDLTHLSARGYTYLTDALRNDISLH